MFTPIWILFWIGTWSLQCLFLKPSYSGIEPKFTLENCLFDKFYPPLPNKLHPRCFLFFFVVFQLPKRDSDVFRFNSFLESNPENCSRNPERGVTLGSSTMSLFPRKTEDYQLLMLRPTTPHENIEQLDNCSFSSYFSTFLMTKMAVL